MGVKGIVDLGGRYWYDYMMPKPKVPLALWEDPRVQKVYDLICQDPFVKRCPKTDHWEGWLARRIVAELELL